MRLLAFYILIIFCATTQAAQGQTSPTNGKISGQIVDTISNNVNRATISLMQASDTLNVKRTLSDSTGHFSFEQMPFSTYILRIAFQGYEVLNRYVTLSADNPEVSLGEITLQESLNELGTVVVTALVPVTFKGDTTEFNADAFGTKPHATVEDLLKKLPGVEVAKDGTIQSQGEAVPRVFLDGKRFFGGDDPKLATQNLPKDMVDKIQVFDGKSDKAEFTGFDDGNSIKTINIVTKKDKRKGWFGKSSAGIGNDDAEFKNGLYAANARIFRMDGDKQIAFLGQLNNTNQQMFSRSGGNNNGLTKTIAGGLNYRDKFGEKTDFSGSYFYHNTHQVVDDKSYTQKLFNDDTSQLTNRNSLSISNDQNHRFNFNIETNFDSSNKLRIRPNISFSKGDNESNSTSTIGRLVGEDTAAISSSKSKNSSETNSYNADLETTYQHAFRKKGRSVSLELEVSANRNENTGSNFADIYTFEDDLDSLTNQRYSSINDSKSVSSTISYTEPIATHQLLELEFNNSYRKTNSDRKTYNYDSTTGGYTTANEFLTNLYENTYQSNRGTLSYMYNDGSLQVSAGAGVQFGKLVSDNLSKDIHLTQDYVNLYPTASMSYKFSKTRRLRFNYRGRTSQPSVQQLQPVVDNSNQLNIVTGNPALKQSFNHNILLRYSNFDRENSKTFFATVSGDIIENNISNAIYRLPNGGDSTIPVNLSGFYNVSGYLNWGFPLKWPKSNLNLSTRVSNRRSASLIDDVKSYTYNTILTQRIGWTTNLSEGLDVNFSTDPTYNITHYTVNKNQSGNYYSQSLSFEGTWFSKSGWEIGSNFDYTFYSGLPEGQNTAIPIWNASIAKLLFKDQAGEIKLSVYDLLNQNKGITFDRTDNIIQQSQSNVLRRYLMLTFTYNLQKFGGKGKGGPRGEGGGRRGRDGGFGGGSFGGRGGGGRF